MAGTCSGVRSPASRKFEASTGEALRMRLRQTDFASHAGRTGRS